MQRKGEGCGRSAWRRFLSTAATMLAIAGLGIWLTACGGSSSTDTTSTAAAVVGAPRNEVSKLPLPVKGGTPAEEHPGNALYGSPPLVFEVDPSGKPAYVSPAKQTAREGNVTIELVNRTSTPEGIVIEALPSHGRVTTEPIERGIGAVTITLNRKEKFIFYSATPSRRKAGMEGVIKVTPWVSHG